MRTTYTVVALTIFPLLLAGFVVLYLRDATAYAVALEEDGVVESATAALLVAAAALALLRTDGGRRARDPAWRFYAGLTVLLTLAALEEVSWGQRFFEIDSPAFFLRHSDQKEINLHNVFQRWSGITTKWVAGITLSAYGIALPVLAAAVPRVLDWATRRHIAVPPLVLVPGFLAGALLMLDLPTYQEEEIAEMFFALCFLLLLLQPRDAEGARA